MVEDGAVQGVVAIELRTGKVRAIQAKAVNYLHRRCGRVFPFTTNREYLHRRRDGARVPGRRAAKRQEMTQYHPTGLPFTGILITEAARAEGGWLLNKDDYRFLQTTIWASLLRPRSFAVWNWDRGDRVSRAIVASSRRGAPSTDVWDLRSSRPATSRRAQIGVRLPMVRELCLKYEISIRSTSRFGVPAVLHYMMAACISISTRRRRCRLFAAGEAACVSISMARTGWVRTRSSESWCMAPFGTFGAAIYRGRQRRSNQSAILSQAADEDAAWSSNFCARPAGTERIAKLRDEMSHTMETAAASTASAIRWWTPRTSSASCTSVSERRDGRHTGHSTRSLPQHWSWFHARRGRDHRA